MADKIYYYKNHNLSHVWRTIGPSKGEYPVGVESLRLSSVTEEIGKETFIRLKFDGFTDATSEEVLLNLQIEGRAHRKGVKSKIAISTVTGDIKGGTPGPMTMLDYYPDATPTVEIDGMEHEYVESKDYTRTLTDEQVVLAALKKAGKNNTYCRNKALEIEQPGVIMFPDKMAREFFYHPIAKAFWGHQQSEWFQDDKGAMKTKPAWKWHLQQMVLEENPIDYLRKFI
jgi:hypothetical protein